MFKLVVLSALVAIVSARPSHLAAPLEYAAIAGPAVAIPAAVSHQSRTDIISKPVVATYAAAPVLAHAAPVAVAHAAPVAVAHAVPIAVPAAVSHTARFDVHSSPLAWASVRAVPAVHALHAAPALHQW